MLKSDDVTAVQKISSYFDDVGYRYINARTIPEAFPKFEEIQEKLKAYQDMHRFLLTVFRQGHAAEPIYFHHSLPPDVFDAMVSTGLLVETSMGKWKTPGLTLLPIEGLLLAFSLPLEYPIHTDAARSVYLDEGSLWMTQVIPAHMANQSVLDVCSGSGILGLICAARGARHVLCLENSDKAISVARFNTALNGLADRVEVRQSDLFSDLRPEETFEYVMANPPYTPVVEDLEFATCIAGGRDGTYVLRQFFAGIGHWLATSARADVYCPVLGESQHIGFNEDVLRPLAYKEDMLVRAYVMDKLSMDQFLKKELSRKYQSFLPFISSADRHEKIAGWLKENAARYSHFYYQHVRIWKGKDTDFSYWPFYNPDLTDVLSSKIQSAKLFS